MPLPPDAQAAFDADLATMTRVQTVPIDPLNYGRDLSCVLDVTNDFAEVDPNSPLGIAQAVTRRLITNRDDLLDDGTYGFNVRAMLNHPQTVDELRSLEISCINEANKEERVQRADISVSMNALGSEIAIAIAITPADPVLRPFAFVLAVTDAQVLIELIGA
jgi:hypothetical protein